jgi:hypothetical protein
VATEGASVSAVVMVIFFAKLREGKASVPMESVAAEPTRKSRRVSDEDSGVLGDGPRERTSLSHPGGYCGFSCDMDGSLIAFDG